jgi:hypothetical protein
MLRAAKEQHRFWLFSALFGQKTLIRVTNPLTGHTAHGHGISMPDRSSKRPRDANQVAKLMVDISTGNATDPDVHQEGDSRDPAAVSLGRRGGVKGGPARAVLLSAERRSEIAKGAALARWKKNDR